MIAALVLLGCGTTPPGPPPSDEHWVTVEGGTFLMGMADGGPMGFAGPQHEVTVPTFQLQRHEALSVDYARCIEAGVCPKLPEGDLCARGTDPKQPQNCLSWTAAEALCGFLGARLPSEAEWEYAASSGGKNLYPWGDAPPDCSRANLLIGDAPWCPGGKPVWDVCSQPAGNTPSGLCEMGGNLFEWNADRFAWDYKDHPRDGSAQRVGTEHFSMRGGAIGSGALLDTRTRTYHPPDFHYPGMGVRCARSVVTNGR